MTEQKKDETGPILPPPPGLTPVDITKSQMVLCNQCGTSNKQFHDIGDDFKELMALI